MKSGLSFFWPVVLILGNLMVTEAPPPAHGLPLEAGKSASPAIVECKVGHTLLLRESPYPPPPSGHRGFDVLHYNLDIRLNPTSSRISGSVEIILRSLEASLDTIQLDLVNELTCTQVTQDASLLNFDHGSDALHIALNSPLDAGHETAITVFWEGRPPRHGEMLVGLLFRHHNSGTLDDPSDDVPIIANISEPWSAHSWWPCKDHPADKALVSLSATIPDTLNLVSNGRLLGVESVESGWHRYRWAESYPLATYLVNVAATNYQHWTEDCLTSSGNVPLEYYVFPQDREKAEHDFAPTCQMMDFMTSIAGPYPFAGEKYAQVEIKWVGAMEHTTASSISQILITGDGTYETLLLHELAHQWFGDSLTPGRWADIWLNEGFARYSEALWVEHTRGHDAYVQFMQSIGRDRHPDLFANEGILGDPDPILPNILIYNKGAWLLHSLRNLLGDDVFFSLLRSYAQDPELAQGNVETPQFISRAEFFAGRSLGLFFGPWLESSTVPIVSYSTEKSPDSIRLRFQQNQDQIMEIAIPVVMETFCGPQKATLVLDQRENEFILESECRISRVQVDPQQMAFMFQAQAPDPELEVLGPWPNPMGSVEGSFHIFTTRSGSITVGMFDVKGRKIGDWNLGQQGATGPRSHEESLPAVWNLSLADLEIPPASGTYWLEFKLGGSRAVRKISLVH